MNIKELETRVAELSKQKEDLEKRVKAAEERKKQEERNNSYYKGNFKTMEKKENRAWQDIAKAMVENRSITITSTLSHDTANGIGAINQVADLWDLIKQKEPLLDRISYFNGPNFETQIPVLEARPAVPTAYAETADHSGAVDSTAAVKVKKINPQTYFAVLPITYEAARQSFVGLEDRIPGLLAESFRTAMCKNVFDGIFDDDNVAEANVITTASASAVSFADLEALALKVLDTDAAEPVIVMNPAIYGALASADAQGYNFLKEELVRNKTLEGVKVILSGKAPTMSGASAGDIVVWAGDLKNFAMGVADQVTVEPLKKVGDPTIYFQAIAAFDGIVVQPKNVFGLSKKA